MTEDLQALHGSCSQLCAPSLVGKLGVCSRWSFLACVCPLSSEGILCARAFRFWMSDQLQERDNSSDKLTTATNLPIIEGRGLAEWGDTEQRSPSNRESEHSLWNWKERTDGSSPKHVYNKGRHLIAEGWAWSWVGSESQTVVTERMPRASPSPSSRFPWAMNSWTVVNLSNSCNRQSIMTGRLGEGEGLG